MTLVQWFPGHMAKARRQVAEKAKMVDVIIEVVDARIPATSSNPDLPALTAPRPRVVVLNKADVADPVATGAWVAHHRQAGVTAVPVDAVKGTGAAEVLAAVQAAFRPVLASLQAKGRFGRPARVMVIGMPNVGKSSLINRLAGRYKAAVGARPGHTRTQQWIRVGKEVELLDTPGILVPKVLEMQQGIRMAALGLVKEEVIDAEAVAGAILPELWAAAPERVTERFGLTRLSDDALENMERIARAKSLLRPGGLPDTGRAAALILKEIRDGKLGRVTLERPPVDAAKTQ